MYFKVTVREEMRMCCVRGGMWGGKIAGGPDLDILQSLISLFQKIHFGLVSKVYYILPQQNRTLGASLHYKPHCLYQYLFFNQSIAPGYCFLKVS